MAAHAITCGTGCSPVVHTLAALILPAHLIPDLRMCQTRLNPFPLSGWQSSQPRLLHCFWSCH